MNRMIQEALGKVNIPVSEATFKINRERAIDYLNTRERPGHERSPAKHKGPNVVYSRWYRIWVIKE